MVEPLSGGSHDLEQTLKPFYQRASGRDGHDEEHLKTISELQSKLDSANEALIAERKKAEMVAAENAKLQYRIIHLVRTGRETHKNVEQN